MKCKIWVSQDAKEVEEHAEVINSRMGQSQFDFVLQAY